MARTKATVTKVGDKLTKVNDCFSVNMYDNGYMVEVGGRDSDNEYKTVKLLVTTVGDLQAIVNEIADMERDS